MPQERDTLEFWVRASSVSDPIRHTTLARTAVGAAQTLQRSRLGAPPGLHYLMGWGVTGVRQRWRRVWLAFQLHSFTGGSQGLCRTLICSFLYLQDIQNLKCHLERLTVNINWIPEVRETGDAEDAHAGPVGGFPVIVVQVSMSWACFSPYLHLGCCPQKYGMM